MRNFLLAIFCMGSQAAFSQDTSMQVKPDWVVYDVPAVKMELINRVRALITDSLKLYTSEQFYTRFAKTDSMFVYLYVSAKDSVKQVTHTPYIYFGNSPSRAQHKADSFAGAGFDVMVYQTAGTSAAFINKRLLEYDNLSITFIMIHEAVHCHMGSKVPYEFEEALCDVIANSFCGWFSGSPLRNYVQFTYTNEHIYRLINSCRNKRLSKPKCEKKIRSTLVKAPLFQTDRYAYPVNNAYLLRYSSYAYRYFQLRKLYEHIQDPQVFMQEMMMLPKDISLCEKRIKELGVKYR